MPDFCSALILEERLVVLRISRWIKHCVGGRRRNASVSESVGDFVNERVGEIVGDTELLGDAGIRISEWV